MRHNVKEYERILYKELKRRKLFSKFCMAIAQAFAPSYSYDVFGNRRYHPIPKDKKEEYILHFTNYDEKFFEGVKKWNIKSNPMIQP